MVHCQPTWCCCCLFILCLLQLEYDWPLSPPPPGEPVRGWSINLLPFVPADKRKRKREDRLATLASMPHLGGNLLMWVAARTSITTLSHISRNPPPTSVPSGISQLSSPLPCPPCSRAPTAGISTGCGAGGDTHVFGPQFPCITITCCPHGVQSILGMPRQVQGCTWVVRILLLMTVWVKLE